MTSGAGVHVVEEVRSAAGNLGALGEGPAPADYGLARWGQPVERRRGVWAAPVFSLPGWLLGLLADRSAETGKVVVVAGLPLRAFGVTFPSSRQRCCEVIFIDCDRLTTSSSRLRTLFHELGHLLDVFVESRCADDQEAFADGVADVLARWHPASMPALRRTAG